MRQLIHTFLKASLWLKNHRQKEEKKIFTMNQIQLFSNCCSSLKSDVKTKHAADIQDLDGRESSDPSTFKKRTRITAYQRVQLESKFMNSAYISKSDQEQLSMELRLPCKTVQAWFKNRRYRWRKSSSPDKQGSSAGEPPMKLSSGQTSGLCYLPNVTTNSSTTTSTANQTPSLYINSMVPSHSYSSHGFGSHGYSNHGYNGNSYTSLGYGSHDGPFSQMSTSYPANFFTGHRPLGF